MAGPNLFAAELQPLPPVVAPPAGSAPPETTPPVTPFPVGTLPPAMTLGAPAATAVPPTLPGRPEAAPPLPSAVNPETPVLSAIPIQPLPTTAVPETVPQVSQPLRPVSPETLAESAKKIEEEGIYLNMVDEDLKEVIKQISRALGKNFIIDDKIRGKVTIISERKMTKDEIWEAFLSALDVNGFTIVQGPAGLLRLVPVREALSNPIDLYTSASPFSDRFITRLITLKNISATDMANVIKGLVTKEGNLFAYPVTNTLIITDKGTNIDRLLRLINELDKEGPQEVIEIIPILYADAKDLAGKITQIFETSDKGGAVSAPSGKKGEVVGGAIEEIPRLRKVIPDDRSNSLIVLASKMAIKKVRELIKKLDSPLVGDEGEVHVYYLKHSSAKDMATVLTAISGAVQQGKEKKGGGGTTAADAAKTAVSSMVGGAEFSGKFTVSADETTNALIITASSKDYNTLVEQVIAKLDIPRRQVYVEAVIVELIVDMQRDLGTAASGGKVFSAGGNDIALFGNSLGFLSSGVTGLLGGSPSSVGGVSTANPISFTPPGATTAVNVPRFFAALQMQQTNVETNILSTPNILTLDNQEAEINVGETVPFKSTTQATAAGLPPFSTFTREKVALTLKIKPQITEGETIKLDVEQKDDNVKQGTEGSEGGATTTTRSIKTSIVTSNGQTVVLGGLIKDFNSIAIHKIPLLGDIPILGYLFKTKSKTKKKSNLVVFLTPYVIRQPKDFLAILQKKISEQNAFISENFGKGQQKQIRQSLEKHASHLLELGEAPPADLTPAGGQPYAPPTEEEKFPMELAPPPSLESGPAAPDSEDSDLAIEPGSQKKGKKKPKAAAPQQAPAEVAPESPSSTSTPSSDDDIDLAY